MSSVGYVSLWSGHQSQAHESELSRLLVGQFLINSTHKQQDLWNLGVVICTCFPQGLLEPRLKTNMVRGISGKRYMHIDMRSFLFIFFMALGIEPQPFLF